MVEKKILVDDLRLEYSGLFNVNDLFKLFDELILERSYIRYEKKSEEYVTDTGKTITLELRPTKEFEMDFSAYIKIRVKLSNIKKVTLEVDGVRKTFDQGNILIIFDGWTSTSYEWAWETKPIFVFIRMLFDKYFKKISFGKYEGEIITDTKYWYRRVKSHLNLYRYMAMPDKQEKEKLEATNVA